MRVHQDESLWGWEFMTMRLSWRWDNHGDEFFWRWVLLEMQTFKDAFVVAVASFLPDEFSLFLFVVFGGEVVSTAAICSRLVVHPIKDFIPWRISSHTRFTGCFNHPCGRTRAAVCVSASFGRTQQKPSRLFRLPQSVDVILFNVETELIKVSRISRKHSFVTRREDLGELESLI